MAKTWSMVDHGRPRPTNVDHGSTMASVSSSFSRHGLPNQIMAPLPSYSSKAAAEGKDMEQHQLSLYNADDAAARAEYRTTSRTKIVNSALNRAILVYNTNQDKYFTLGYRHYSADPHSADPRFHLMNINTVILFKVCPPSSPLPLPSPPLPRPPLNTITKLNLERSRRGSAIYPHTTAHNTWD